METITETLKNEGGNLVPQDKSNSWFDGKRWIPVSEMTAAHLRRAKLFAQRKEEFHWFKSGEFGKMVDMLENEATRRGLVLKDYRSKFQKNQRKCKEINKSIS